HALAGAGEVAGLGAREPGPEEELVAIRREFERLRDQSLRLVVIPAGGELFRLLGERVRPVEGVKAAELGERRWMVVDAQVGLAPTDHEQRGRLASAHVAALGLGRVERREEALVERAA